MSRRRICFILTPGLALILIIVLLVIYIPTMASISKISNDAFDDLPFVSNANAIRYVKSSKLMVVVADNEELLQKVKTTYGSNASCISDDDTSKRIMEVETVCAADQHLVAIDIKRFEDSALSDLKPYLEVAFDHNYIFSIINAPENIIPQYVGWHLNEADSCMLGLCAHALLEDLLRHVSEFCSDFRNFTQSETIPEMLQYYKLATSNHNGMLHCTANYFGDNPTPSLQEYFSRVKKNISMSYQTTVIGLVFTPRTFGARLKLSSEQLKLWGGDGNEATLQDLHAGTEPSQGADLVQDQVPEDDCEPITSLCSDLANQSLQNDSGELGVESASSTNNSKSLSLKKKSARYFPNCQASLVCSTVKQSEPDFHPVTGLGRKAHMTIGIADGESAVTTGYDLLEIVDLEGQEKKWPTYPCSRGWLRDYGEGRWVLYMNNRITVNSLFAGVYVVP